MSKGINTIIEETKIEFINLINSKLEKGLPISVIGLIVDDVSAKIKTEIGVAINKEKIEETKNASEEN